MKKLIALTMAVLMALSLCACDVTYDTSAGGAQQNIEDTQKVTDKLTSSQKTPTDIDYSLERYNLIRRSYWVNGQREKANTLVCVRWTSRWGTSSCLPRLAALWGASSWTEKFPASTAF